jgi:hypothetical protein
MQFQLSFVAAAALLATPAIAQETPPTGGVPIYDITPQVVPTIPPAPTPTPAATPTPRATATPRARPTPRATPTPRPTPSATPTRTPEPRATPVALPSPRSTPVATPTIAPTPEVTASPEPVVTPTVVATPVSQVPSSDGLPGWAWFLAGLAVAGLGALLIGRLRRREVPADVERFEPVAETPSAPEVREPGPLPVVPEPVVASVPVTPPTEILEFQLSPLRVGTQGDNALLDFDLTVGNPTATAVPEVRIATLMLTANAQQDQQLAAFFAAEGPRGLEPFALAPGERRLVEATMSLPRAAVNVVTAQERPFFVPLMAIDARYRWADGREARTTAAFVIGPPLATGKLSPIFLDRGDRMIDRLEARLHGEVRRT